MDYMNLTEIDGGFIEEVENILGMGCGAWDMVDPLEIASAVISVATNRGLNKAVKTMMMLADSELSAIGAGQKPANRHYLMAIAWELRNIYDPVIGNRSHVVGELVKKFDSQDVHANLLNHN